MRIVLSLLTFSYAYFLSHIGTLRFDEWFEIVNFIIIFISSFAIYSYIDRPYSLYKMFHLFVLFFMGVAPAVQFNNDIRFFGTYFSDELYICTSIVVLFTLIVYNIVYAFFYVKSKKQIILLQETRSEVLTPKIELIFILISSCVFLFTLYKNHFNILSMFVRGGEFTDRIELSTTQGLLVNNILPPMSMILFLLAKLKGTTHKHVVPILFALFFFSCPPTGMSRFAVAALYIPIVVTIFPVLKRKHAFVTLISVSLLVVFPFLNSFRYFTGRDSLKLELNIDQFQELHFDSFSMLMRVLDADVVTWGRQLIGVLFFWLPRSVWPNKPIGSGAYIAQVENFGFENVSMPFWGEAYINFGYCGVLFFIVILAIFSAKQDNKYWNKSNLERKSIDTIKYLILIGFLVFMLRGDLMSSTAYLCGYLFTLYLIKFLVKVK